MKGTICIAAAALMIQCVHAQPVITAEPESRTAAEGRPVTFSVQAQGTGTLRYQWQFNGAALPRATGRSLSFYATQSRAGTYSVVVTDTAGARNSAPANLEVQKRPVITAQPRRQIVGEHQTAVFEVRVNDSGPYNNVQWWHHSIAEPHHPIPSNAALGVNTFHLEIPDANNNDTFNGLYWIVITNNVGWAVSKHASLSVVGPPQFTSEPQDRSVRRGGTATFSVTIAPDAGGQKRKQWYRDGEPIPGAVGRRLSIFNAQLDDQATYYCVVASMGGSSTSYPARLTVF
jgi:membrane carboxypeptidase/penicillin-binding protein PbpC